MASDALTDPGRNGSSKLVAANVPQYRYIVEALRDLEYAPKDVAELQVQMRMTREKIVKEEETVAVLHAVTKRLLKEWHDSQGSSGKRLWDKMKHKAEHKDLTPHQAAKLKAYTEASEQEQAYRLRVRVLEGKDAELVQQTKNLQPVLAEHTRMRARLDSLYESVFHMPAGDGAYPQQDAAERAFESARAWLRELEPVLERELLALERLESAHASISETVVHMRMAHRVAVAKGSESAQIEAQRKATAAAQSAVKAHEAAHKSKPTLECVTMPRIVLSDLFRFCGWSAIGKTDIMHALDEAKQTQASMESVLRRQTQEVAGIRIKTDRAREELRSATETLEAERRRIFDSAFSALNNSQAADAVAAELPVDARSVRSRNECSVTTVSPRSSLDGRTAIAPTQPPTYSEPELQEQYHTRTTSSAAGLSMMPPVQCPSDDLVPKSPMSPPPVYGQPCIFPPVPQHGGSTHSQYQQGTAQRRSHDLPPLGRQLTIESAYGNALSPVSTRDSDISTPDANCYTSSHHVPPPMRQVRSMSASTTDSVPMSIQGTRQRPLPKPPSRPPGSEATRIQHAPELANSGAERPRASTLRNSSPRSELQQQRAHTLPLPVAESVEQQPEVPPVPQHEPEDMAKLRLEGERALQEMQRATEEFERIRRELANRAGGRDSGDAGVTVVYPQAQKVVPSSRRSSQQPPPTYSVQRREDERGYFYISN